MSKKIKIEIKSWLNGSVLFEYEAEDNTIAKTVEEAIKEEANLSSADLRSANLRYANLSSADLSSADLRSADLRSADLRYADLSSADLSSADLRYANLSSADLSSADLSSADLRSADLSYADLRSANLRYADLSYADLRYANLSSADLSSADLSSADLRSADLSSADLSSADLSYADLRSANLRYANLSYADLRYANLSSADLREIPFENLPTFWVNLCSRDILFVLEHLKSEVPFLKDKLLKGEVDGSQYEGDCACLVGTLAKATNEEADNDDVEKVCSVIPFYEMDLNNPGEQWFLQIKEGDTPKDNVFSKHAVELCNRVLGLPISDGLELKEVEAPELIEIDGKKYRKDELDKRLEELKPVE